MAGNNKLSAARVNSLKQPGRYGDGDGLWLQIGPSGTKSWLFRYERDGRERQMGLGPLALVSLAEAREKTHACRKILLDGRDPIEERRATRASARAEAAKGITFRDCAARYIAAHRAGWRNAKHAAQWGSTLEAYASPHFGDLHVGAIDTALVLKAIEPIWTEKPETASRVRGRIESVLDWATARGYRRGENPARWKGHLDHLLPRRQKLARVRHHPALPYQDVPEFMAALRAQTGVSARALEFTILTAARTGEALGARWPEIDFKSRTWTVPGDRMKAGREHRVPLPDRAVEILSALPREGEFVFIGARAGRPLSNMALLMTLRRMNREAITAHGFRSSFRDWAAETTAYPSEVAEMALGHTVRSAVEAAYRRGDLFEKRRRLMADWAKYCEGARTRALVTPIRGTA